MILDPLKPYLKLAEVLAIAGLAAWGWGWHRDKVATADRAGYDRATAEMQVKVNESQQAALAALAAQAKAQQDAEKYHADLVAAGKRTTDSIAVSLHDITDSLRRGLLPGAVVNPGQSGGAVAGTGGAGELEAAIRSFTASVDLLSKSCQHDTNELAAILKLAHDNGAVK